MTIADAPAGALDETAESGRTALYRLYGADDELLYIGISDDPVSRMAQHAGGKPWWTAVARRTIVWYPYRTQAETAETIAIGLEQPRHNKAKRYVRLPEQAFPERASRARALVRPKPTLTEAQFADVTEQPAAPRPAITLDRFNPNWNPEWDQGFPPEWPADLWCVSYYFRTGSTGLCYEDFMRARGGQCDEFDNPTSLDFLRERAQGRKEGWD